MHMAHRYHSSRSIHVMINLEFQYRDVKTYQELDLESYAAGKTHQLAVLVGHISHNRLNHISLQ
jgi:hypothetical protein